MIKDVQIQNFEILEKLNSIGSWEFDFYTKKAIWSQQNYVNFGYVPYSIEPSLEIFFSNVIPSDLAYAKEALKSLLLRKKSISFQCKIRQNSGEIVNLLLSASFLKNSDENLHKIIGTTQNISQFSNFKEQEKNTLTEIVEYSLKLQHLAHHDSLTELPNRTLFHDRLLQSIITSKRHEQGFALLFIDLDQFKKINDTLGHNIGDKVLVESSKRLRKCVREADTIARLGGDEFTIILKNIVDENSISGIAKKIVFAIKEPIYIDEHILYISASIGISLYPSDATTSTDLTKFADTAMYKAKDAGRDNYQYYNSQMTVLAFEKVVMDASLRVAIKNEEFIVYFQPQYNFLTSEIVGLEALVRWQHPKKGLVFPDVFIPLAEESGLIIDIDTIVMKKAMKQFVLWYKDGLNPGTLALNLSMKQLNENDFINKLLETAKEIGFNTSWLELEVTEGQVMQNHESSIEKLYSLSRLGIKIAIDDFGTGYSSLSYLKKLPLDKLKIDKSFIQEIPHDEDDMAITKAIIALGKSLNFKLIAEGVETQEHKDFLIENGCDFVQGYFYSKPIPIEAITKLLKG